MQSELRILSIIHKVKIKLVDGRGYVLGASTFTFAILLYKLAAIILICFLENNHRPLLLYSFPREESLILVFLQTKLNVEIFLINFAGIWVFSIKKVQQTLI